jgi:hypothetical protein
VTFSFVESIDSFGEGETRAIRDYIGKPAEEYLTHFLEKGLFMKVLMFNVIETSGAPKTMLFLAPSLMQAMFAGGDYETVLKIAGNAVRLVVKDRKGKAYVFQDSRLAGSGKLSMVTMKAESKLDLGKVNAEFNFARNLKYSTTVLEKGKVVEKGVKSPYTQVLAQKDGTLAFSKKK